MFIDVEQEEECRRGREQQPGRRQIVVTDSIPLTPEKHLPNIKVLSVAPLLADAIKRIHFNESVSKLFEGGT